VVIANPGKPRESSDSREGPRQQKSYFDAIFKMRQADAFSGMILNVNGGKTRGHVAFPDGTRHITEVEKDE
jgi:hypothetical protein